MHEILSYIEDRKRGLRHHPFFELLERDEPLERILPFIPLSGFWVMTFQDALRLNAEGLRDSPLERIARHHLSEDAGHDIWYLDDLRLTFGTYPTLPEIFSEEYRACREASFAIISESFGSPTDAARITFLLTLESTGQVFFPHVVEYFRRAGVEPALKYFAQTHLDVERDHELVDERMLQELSRIDLSAETTLQCLATVDRCYAAFEKLFGSFADTIRTADPNTVGQLRGNAREMLVKAREVQRIRSSPMAARP